MQRSKQTLFQWLWRKQRQDSAGFTLLELLISMLIASIVVSGLLYLVVELAQIDRRESILDEVQRDMQRAMDYIGDDLQEAVYVYPNPERIAGLLDRDPKFPSDRENDTPVLAFWRIDPIENSPLGLCTPGSSNFNSTAADFQSCRVLRIRQSAYTLVVYVQRVNNGRNSANWSGRSRLIRYELSKYSNLDTLTIRNGYRDPTNSTDSVAGFEVWKPKISGGTPAGNSAVLTDFVQSPTVLLNRPPLSPAASAATTPSCSSFGSDASGNALYKVVPSTATTTSNTSFFACVRDDDLDDNPDTLERSNQDVYVFLRGNAVDGPPGVVNAFSEESALPVLETRVLVKGIIDKDLQ